MTAVASCPGCGYVAAAVVTARFEMFIALDGKSDNGRIVNSGSSRWAYKANRQLWAWHIRTAMRAAGVPATDRRRRLTITRVYSGRQRSKDRDSMVTSYKPAVDELVTFKLLVDDSAKWCDGPYYLQEHGSVSGTRFVFEELEATNVRP